MPAVSPISRVLQDDRLETSSLSGRSKRDHLRRQPREEVVADKLHSLVEHRAPIAFLVLERPVHSAVGRADRRRQFAETGTGFLRGDRTH
jgi:hypothetical protein